MCVLFVAYILNVSLVLKGAAFIDVSIVQVEVIQDRVEPNTPPRESNSISTSTSSSPAPVTMPSPPPAPKREESPEVGPLSSQFILRSFFPPNQSLLVACIHTIYKAEISVKVCWE